MLHRLVYYRVLCEFSIFHNSVTRSTINTSTSRRILIQFKKFASLYCFISLKNRYRSHSQSTPYRGRNANNNSFLCANHYALSSHQESRYLSSENAICLSCMRNSFENSVTFHTYYGIFCKVSNGKWLKLRTILKTYNDNFPDNIRFLHSRPIANQSVWMLLSVKKEETQKLLNLNSQELYL